MDSTETAILIGAIVVLGLVAVYVATRPPPEAEADISWQQASQLIAWYYGLG